MKKFLVKHVGNMGDLVFIVPPVLETLKKVYPDCQITFVTAWGFKRNHRKFPRFQKKAYWGERNQGGFCISLMMTNPHIDQLVHFHSTETSLEGNICHEEGSSFPTWSASYYEEQKLSGEYDDVFELDFGIDVSDNPIKKAYQVCGLPDETFANYKLYFSDEDMQIAKEVMEGKPYPRIVLLEGIEGSSARGWDPNKVTILEKHIEDSYGVPPIWFGAKHIPEHNGKPLTLRQNIATLPFCDVAIGVLSGPLHFAAAVGLPTICLYGDHPLHRAAPAYFLNRYINEVNQKHRTLLGPTNYNDMRLLKDISPNLTPAEIKKQGFASWASPGAQITKSCVAQLTPSEVQSVLAAFALGKEPQAH